MTVRLATRGSPLARWQAGEVARRLAATHPGVEVELVAVESSGDTRQDVPIWELGGQGVFVKEIQAAVLDGRADAAVHSAKDLPAGQPAAGLVLAAFPGRDDPRDALAGSTLAGLAPGATVATGSVRRRAQLAAARPDLTFVGVRGNVQTRLRRVPAGGALVVAMAALRRLGLESEAAEVLDPAVMLPQVGQGALAVECRDDDESTRRLLAGIDDPSVRATVSAERAFLARFGGGCDLPVGAYAVLDGPDLVVEGFLASLDGSTLLRASRRGPAADGTVTATSLAEHLLVDRGGARLLSGSSP